MPVVEMAAHRCRGDESTGNGFVAVSKVVAKVVSVGLQHVEGLVLDLPAGATAGGLLGDGVGGDGESGTKLL